jgi:hypothetical protein
MQGKFDNSYFGSADTKNNSQLVTMHVQALFNNNPRRRRYFMKHLVDWHGLYEILVEIKHVIDLDVCLI